MSYKKKLLALLILVTSLACSNSSLEKGNIETETTPDNSRSVRNIYIGDQDYLDSLENIGYNDVLVLDLRDDENDPDVKVYNSYRIKDSISMKKVIDN